MFSRNSLLVLPENRLKVTRDISFNLFNNDCVHAECRTAVPRNE